MSRRPRWSRADEDAIRLQAGKATAAQTAQEIGRSRNSVSLKIADMKKRGQFTLKERLTEDERVERMMWLTAHLSVLRGQLRKAA
jgi:hypothetical protein